MTKTSKTKSIDRYCRKFGNKLVRRQNYAEKELQISTFRHFDKYNYITGKQQMVGWWECPKYHWWNNHDSTWPFLIK